MIYLFTGNSDYLVMENVLNWKNQFIEKYGDFNLIHLKNINEMEFDTYSQHILSSSFLGEKKLVIIDLNNDLQEEVVEFLYKILDKIPNSNILLFNYPSPDKRQKIYKELEKISEIKEYNATSENEVINVINNKFRNKISTSGLNLLIKYKSGNLNKIISELQKLLILKDYIDENDVVNNIIPELEENIFLLIDDLLNNNIISALKKIDIILNDTNIYAFYNNLLANLRTSIYIIKFKQEKVNSNNISQILSLGSRAFLINKNYKISYNRFKLLYIDLINLDKKMKSGKLIGTEEKDFRFELEKCLLKTAS
ncbi:MAG: hypothetical protein PHV23_00965 [Candidatus Gracilibacteria bacterium]|nr:hypothetical protein [Candidatus Gracilibacteria bacterium]